VPVPAVQTFTKNYETKVANNGAKSTNPSSKPPTDYGVNKVALSGSELFQIFVRAGSVASVYTDPFRPCSQKTVISVRFW